MKTIDKDSGINLKLPPKHDYDIGYGKPPTASQFKPGQSGNPRGRPRGARNRTRAQPLGDMTDIILKEGYRKIPIQEGGKTRYLPIVQATMRSMGIAAVKGQARAQRLLTQIVHRAEEYRRQCKEELFKTALDYQLFWEEELARRKREGIIADDPVPHPNQIKLDVKSGQVYMKGPLTAEQKTYLAQLRANEQEFRDTLSQLEHERVLEQDPEQKAALEEDIAHLRWVLEKVIS